MDDAMLNTQKYKRIENDAYYTPPWVTEALLKNVGFKKEDIIWEPAAGQKHMGNVLMRKHRVYMSDIATPSAAGVVIHDFLNEEISPTVFKHIVTNPPYSHAKQFIKKALGYASKTGGKVAMLLRNEFDSAVTRKNLFGDHPAFALKIVLTKRPRWFDDGGSPRHNYAWFVWNFSPSFIYTKSTPPTSIGGYWPELRYDQ